MNKRVKMIKERVENDVGWKKSDEYREEWLKEK